MGSDPLVANIAAWGALLAILALLIVVMLRDRVCSQGELVITLIGALVLALTGVISSQLSTMQHDELWDIGRFAINVLRGIAMALYLGLLLHRLGWTPPGLRRFL